MQQITRLTCTLLLFIASPTSVPAGEQDLIRQMQSGNTVLMVRHALAPGVGDPEVFDLADCSTQRNLNQTGRDQAKAIGLWLRSRGIQHVKLYSS